MKRIITAALLAIVLAGCATQGKYAGGSYSGSEARRGAVTRTGTVIAIAPVTIKDEASGLGALTGAGFGALAGSTVGGGRGVPAAAVAAGIAGLLIGNAIESQVNTHNAARITIKLDNGTTTTIVQGMDAELASMRVGDKVFVFDQNNTLRVSR